MEGIIVVTPTYNRKKVLYRLYQSLEAQTNQNFQWLIIDDGSTDKTEEKINQLVNQSKLKINYVKKDNGGKASALNCAFELVKKNSLLIIVDSDDVLFNDAIEKITEYYEMYKYDQNVGAFFFKYQLTDGVVLEDDRNKLDNDKKLTRYEYNNKYRQNDGCVAYFGRMVKKYRYPIFNQEKYIGPTVIQMEMASEYKMIFSSKVIGVAEYQNDGLSNSGRKLRLNNPKGMIYYCQLQTSKKNTFFNQIKYSISMWPYLKLGKFSFIDAIKKFPNKLIGLLTYIPGKILLFLWERENEKK